jgi:protein gp37
MFTNKVNLGRTRYWYAWKGCKKISTACKNCFVSNFDTVQLITLEAPKGKFGDVVIVCLHSDFFIEEADVYRMQAWEEIKNHPEQIFIIITKRIERIHKCLPDDWGDGYDNVVLSITTETQELVDYRIPLFLQIPCKHRWLSCCPLIEPLQLQKHLAFGDIEHVEVCGEIGNPEIIRPTYYEWVEDLSLQCKAANIRFSFMKIGQYFIKYNQVLSERCACYHSPFADNYRLDNDVPLIFKLNNKEFIMK